MAVRTWPCKLHITASVLSFTSAMASSSPETLYCGGRKESTACKPALLQKLVGEFFRFFGGKFQGKFSGGQEKNNKLNFLWPKMARLGPRF